MVQFILDFGIKIIKNKDLDNSIGEMVQNILGFGKKIRQMAKVD